MMDDKLINSKDVDLAAVMIDGVAAVLLLPPVASFTVSAVRSITQLNEDQFKEKLKLFLIEADSPQENKDKFLNLLDKDADKFFNRLFKILDRIEDEQKATMIGKLFKALLQDKITVDDFKELCSKLDQAYLGDLELLYDFSVLGSPEKVTPDSDEMDYKYYLRYGMDSGGAQPIIALGLAYEDLKITSTNRMDESEISKSSQYVLSPLGRKLVKYGLIYY